MAATSVLFLTHEEFTQTPIYQIDKRIYHRVERKIARFLGDKTREFMEKFADRPMSFFYNCKYVDLTACFQLV